MKLRVQLFFLFIFFAFIGLLSPKLLQKIGLDTIIKMNEKLKPLIKTKKQTIIKAPPWMRN